MKAKLLLIINEDDLDGTDRIELQLNVNDLRRKVLASSVIDFDLNSYKESIEDLFREAEIYRNAIPNLKLSVDDSVLKYMELDIDEIRRFVDSLRVEM